ncbi:MAG: TfoX/Sxy family protein [Acidobacteriota bacterium]
MPKSKAKAKAPAKAMPNFEPAPEELVHTFADAMKDFPMATQRKMFGYPAAFVNGNMFAGLFQDAMFLRLSDEDRAAFRSEYSARLFEPMPGRPMRGYVLVPRFVLKSPKLLKAWTSKAMEYTGSLPPKASRSKAKK